MIRYDLTCDKGHAFDSWFSDSASFEKQANRGFVVCPHCGSSKVKKALMAPRVSGTRTQNQTPDTAAAPVAMTSQRDSDMRAMLRSLHEHVKKNADDVGTKFAEEARKMHYGETDQRAIYGQANMEEAKAMHEEGIEFHPLPDLPGDRN